jgi:hypothetical protein
VLIPNKYRIRKRDDSVIRRCVTTEEIPWPLRVRGNSKDKIIDQRTDTKPVGLSDKEIEDTVATLVKGYT